MHAGVHSHVCPPRARRWLLGFILAVGWFLTSAPPVPAGLLDLAWDAPTTNADDTPLTDLDHYRVYVGTAGAPCPGGAYQPVPAPSPAPAAGEAVTTTVPGLLAGTTYLAQVTAVDASGNESLCSNQASGAAKADAPDTTAPTGTLTLNSGAAATPWTAATLGLAATDAVGVTAYYVSTSATPPGATSWEGIPGTPSYSNPNVPYTLASGDGTKTVYAWYKDAAGNVSGTASDSITLDQTAPSDGTLNATAGDAQVTDTTAPTVSITSPTSNPTYDTSSNTIALGGTASDNLAVTQVTWANDRGGSGTATGTTSWTASAITLRGGTNILTVTGQDAIGNKGAKTLTAKRHPKSKITAGPTGTITTDSASFAWSDSYSDVQPGSLTYAYRLDPVESSYSAFGPTTAKTYTNLAKGNYTFSVKARDQEGNEDLTPVSQSFTVAAPLTLAGLTADKSAPQPIGTPITFTAGASGGTSPYQYRWYVYNGSTWSLGQEWGSSTFVWTPTVAGNYQLQVWARSSGTTGAPPEAYSGLPFVITGP